MSTYFWRKHMTRAQTGFTLIELLVTMVILTIGLLGTAGLTAGIIRVNFFGRNIGSATVIAETQLEAVQREGYLNVTTIRFPSGTETVTMGGVNFSRTTTIADVTPGSNMKTVTVVVSWTEADNAARSVTLQTILAR